VSQIASNDEPLRIIKLLGGPDGKAGTEQSTHLSSSGLRSSGHTVYLAHELADDGFPAASTYHGCISLPDLFASNRQASHRSADQLIDWGKQQNADVIHVHTWPRSSSVLRLRRHFPVIITIHIPICPIWTRYLQKERRPCDRTVGIGCLTEGYAKLGCGRSCGKGDGYSVPGFVRAIGSAKERLRALAACDRVIAISRSSRCQLVRDGVPEEGIEVVRNPIFPDAEAQPWQPPAHPHRVVFVGRLVGYKGVDHLITATSRTRDDLHLEIIGDGPERGPLAEQTKRLGLTDRVIFRGWLSPDNVATRMRDAAILAVPSLWDEQLGRIGPEAMRQGRPVVAYDVGGISDWLQDNVNGRLIPVGDIDALASALDDIAADGSTARQMGEAGLERAGGWTSHQHAVDIEAVYRGAIQAWRAGR